MFEFGPFADHLVVFGRIEPPVAGADPFKERNDGIVLFQHVFAGAPEVGGAQVQYADILSVEDKCQGEEHADLRIGEGLVRNEIAQ